MYTAKAAAVVTWHSGRRRRRRWLQVAGRMRAGCSRLHHHGRRYPCRLPYQCIGGRRSGPVRGFCNNSSRSSDEKLGRLPLCCHVLPLRCRPASHSRRLVSGASPGIHLSAARLAGGTGTYRSRPKWEHGRSTTTSARPRPWRARALHPTTCWCWCWCSRCCAARAAHAHHALPRLVLPPGCST
jgi:hypothetical protein